MYTLWQLLSLLLHQLSISPFEFDFYWALLEDINFQEPQLSLRPSNYQRQYILQLAVFLLGSLVSIWRKMSGEWTTNSLVNISTITAQGENLRDCWIYHQHRERGLQFLPYHPLSQEIQDYNLSFSSGLSPDTPMSTITSPP